MADQLALLVAGDREGGVAGDQDPALLVADDQRRLGAGVVVLEQLEREAEATARAPAGLVAHVAVGARLTVGAAGAEEDRHLPNGSDAPGRRPPRKPLRFRGRVVARGNRPRDRAGAHRVPADLEHRTPAHHPGLRRLGGPGRLLHRRRAARHDGGRRHLLLARPAADHARLARQPAPARAPRRARRPDGLVRDRGDDPDRDLRPRVQRPDRDRRAQPLPHRRHADRPGAGPAGRRRHLEAGARGGGRGHARRGLGRRSPRRWP